MASNMGPDVAGADSSGGRLFDDGPDSSSDEELLAAYLVLQGFVRKKNRLRTARTVAVWASIMAEEDDEDGDEEEDASRVKLTRRVYPRADYYASAWAVMLRNPDLGDHTSKAGKLFRRRFRVPFPFFQALVALVRDRRWFASASRDVSGRMCIPLELKVLTALQVLSRGNCFDDICQLSLMSEAIAQLTFHKFCKHFAEELYEEHVRLPTGEAREKVLHDYDQLGFTGAIGSTDVTHVRWDRCPASLAHSFTGKEGYPTIAYQATVDHTGRALSITQGFDGAQNDKTIVRNDAAVSRIRRHADYKDYIFYLKDEDGHLCPHKGNYLLVDNGYLKWGILIPPSKFPADNDDTLWSKALESVRKDVECFFGILKGRFRILKLPLLYQKQDDIDNIFFTCCILHNMLHVFDGMDVFESGVNWAGVDGLHDPWAHDPVLDVSTFGSTGPELKGVKDEEAAAHAELKNKLIKHFTYRRNDNDLVWLTR